jgi:copper homeostasis protein CutC
MAVMGRIVQRLVEFLPLLGQAPDETLAQALEQILTLGGPQEARKGIENYQQLKSSGLAATAG